MRSPTQLDLGPAEVAGMVRTAFGPQTAVREAVEFTGGGFAAVWRVALDDGRDVVLKVGPPPDARLLGYERGLIEAEAAYFRLVRERAPGVPVPDVLHHDEGWLITTLLPGRPLTDRAHHGHPDGDAPVRAQLGSAVAAVHAVTGPHFGYTGDRPAAADWPTAFGAILDGLRADADAWDVPLPALDGLVERHAPTLAAVTRPALVHFDLWDGNVLADESRQLTGLVDGERHLYGDPLVDFVSPALFRRIEDEPDHPFLRGYASVAPLDLDESALTRLALYRVFLYVLMLAEGPSRAIPVGGERHIRITGLLQGELDHL